MWRPWSDPPVREVNCVDESDKRTETPEPKLVAGHGVYFSKGQQAAVLSMVKYAKKHGAINPVKDTVKVLGVSPASVYRVLNKGVTSPKKRGNTPGKYRFQRVDDFQWKIIQRTIYDFYAQNYVPSVTTLHRKLREIDPDFSYSETTLRRMLKELGFRFKKLDRRGKIMLSNRILILRDRFLNKMDQLRRDKQPLIFLDETWYDTHDVVKRGWRDGSEQTNLDTPPSRGKRIIILHAGCENGWIPGALLIAAKNIKNASADYHQDMNAELFESWFENHLLPGVDECFPQKKCAIIMDNAPYHSRLARKTPTMKMKKDEILQTLEILGIDIPVGPKKPTKADLIKLYKDAEIEKQYVVDNIAKSKGHEVVRLPPYYCIYNPIELIWASIKKEIRQHNTSPSISASVITLTREAISKVAVELWRKCCEHAAKEERKNLTVPDEPFIININDESSSSEEDEEGDVDIGCALLV